MLKKLRKILIGGALVTLAACDEPVNQPLNPNATPAIDLAVFRDSVTYQGLGNINAQETAADNLDVGTADQLNPTTNNLGDVTAPYPQDPTDGSYLQNTQCILADGADTNNVTINVSNCGGATPSYDLQVTNTVAGVVFPFNYPSLQFNKLINGDKLETTATDPGTQRQVGNCGLVSGAMDMSFTPATGSAGDGGTVADLFACYSPSDRLVTAEAEDSTSQIDAPVPLLFLDYDSNYALHANASIQDKSNKGLTPYTLNFTTGPFELLYVADGGNGTILWAAEDTSVAVTSDDANGNPVTNSVPFDTQELEFIFSGPVTRPLPLNSDGTPVNFNTNPGGAHKAVDPTSVLNNSATPVVTDSTDAAVTGDGGQTPQFDISFPLGSTDASDLLTNDPRVLFLIHPEYIATQGTGDSGSVGFECPGPDNCTFTVHIPSTFTDNSSVMTKAGVEVAQPLYIPADNPGYPDELTVTFDVQPNSSSR